MPEISPTKPITKPQIKAIHVALHRKGIDDATYRDLLERGWGAKSCLDLTRAQASDLLLRLGRPLAREPGEQAPRPARERPKPAPAGVTALPTPAQRQLIEDLVEEIGWMDEDGYRRWLFKSMRVRAVSTREQAAKVIEGLKAMRRRSG